MKIGSLTNTVIEKALYQKLNKNLGLLRSHLDLEDDKEWIGWLRSQNFKPFWDELWNDWLRDNRRQTRGCALDEVLDVAAVYEEDFGFEATAKDRHGWTEVHYLARFMYHVVRRNTRHHDGLFKNRPLRRGEANILMWAALKAMQHLHAPTQINRPSGGPALFNASWKPKTPKSKVDTGTPRTTKKQTKGLYENSTPREEPGTPTPTAGDETVTSSGVIIADAEFTENLADEVADDGVAEDEVAEDEVAEEDISNIEELDRVLLETVSESWKQMLPSYGNPEYPRKISDKFNIDEEYWQLMFMRTAFNRAFEDLNADITLPIDVPPDDKNGEPSDDEMTDADENTDDAMIDADNLDVDDEVTEVAQLNAETTVDTKKLYEDPQDIFEDLKYMAVDDFAWSEQAKDESLTPPEYLLTVTEENLKKHQESFQWLDDSTFQPKDYNHAVKSLHLIERPNKKDKSPRLRHVLMNNGTKLESWQILGVAKLLEMRDAKRPLPGNPPLLRGAFLGDVMGLGKTYQATVYMCEVCLGTLDNRFRRTC